MGWDGLPGRANSPSRRVSAVPSSGVAQQQPAPSSRAPCRFARRSPPVAATLAQAPEAVAALIGLGIAAGTWPADRRRRAWRTPAASGQLPAWPGQSQTPWPQGCGAVTSGARLVTVRFQLLRGGAPATAHWPPRKLARLIPAPPPTGNRCTVAPCALPVTRACRQPSHVSSAAAACRRRRGRVQTFVWRRHRDSAFWGRRSCDGRIPPSRRAAVGADADTDTDADAGRRRDGHDGRGHGSYAPA